MTVAALDTDADGIEELLVGSGAGRISEVKTIRTSNGVGATSFQPFGTFQGGVSVAGGDFDNDGTPEIAI